MNSDIIVATQRHKIFEFARYFDFWFVTTCRPIPFHDFKFLVAKRFIVKSHEPAVKRERTTNNAKSWNGIALKNLLVIFHSLFYKYLSDIPGKFFAIFTNWPGGPGYAIGFFIRITWIFHKCWQDFWLTHNTGQNYFLSLPVKLRKPTYWHMSADSWNYV